MKTDQEVIEEFNKEFGEKTGGFFYEGILHYSRKHQEVIEFILSLRHSDMDSIKEEVEKIESVKVGNGFASFVTMIRKDVVLKLLDIKK